MKKNIFFWLIGILVIAGILSSFASGSPDGLERVAIDHNFIHSEQAFLNFSPFSDYAFAGTESSFLATAIAGIVGVGITWGSIYLVFSWRKKSTVENQ